VSFVTVPFVIVVAVGLTVLFFSPDTPTGPWNERHLNRLSQGIDASSEADGKVVDVSGYEIDEAKQTGPSLSAKSNDIEKYGEDDKVQMEPNIHGQVPTVYDNLDVKFAEAGVIKSPSLKDIATVFFTFPTIMQCALYFVTFGGELAINSNLSSFYIKSSGTPPWSQTYAANWAAMYGLLNVVTRPMGGLIGDWIYPLAGVEGKKLWMIICEIPLIAKQF